MAQDTVATPSARLPGGTRAFAAEGSALRLDLTGAGLGGAWVTIRFSDTGSGGIARLLITQLCADRQGAVLSEEALGGDGFAWTGRLPEGVSALVLSPLAPGRPFALAEFSIRRRGRLALTARAALRHPTSTARAVYWRCLGLKVRGRGLLTAALGHRRGTGYPAWIRRFDTLDGAERARLRHPTATARAVYWRCLGLKVRGRGLLAAALAHRRGTGYPAWIRRFDTLDGPGRARLRAEAAAWPDPPLISILMPVHDPAPAVLEAALRSVRAQLSPHWELCVVDDASTDPAVAGRLAAHAAVDPRIRVMRRAVNGHIARATNDALAMARGAYVAFLDHDDTLAETALFHVGEAVRADPGLVLIYSDEDKIDGRGRRFEPHFKSGFDRELLYGQNYINHLTVVRAAEVRALGGLRPGFEGSQDHDLLLRLTAGLAPERVRHIPRVLYHWRAAGGSGTFSDRALAQAESARLRALAEVAAAFGARAERGPLGFNRLVRPLPDPAPRVSVIIPTRDRAELLGTVLDGLFAATDYPDLEVVVVDNDSREAATRALFARLSGETRLRVLPVPGPFNFSDLSNRGAAAATGTVLLFLNNDVEIIEPGWLTEMVSLVVDPDVGAVGAKLLYPDGTLQHGGIVLGIGGVAGHSHLGLPGAEPGYFARMVLTQEVSAVTGACLAVRTDVFARVGGFDAEHLAVAFNDVDLCLRLRAAGYRNVWTPHARLVHHESKSRGPEDTPEKRARFEAETRVMQARWEPQLRADPYYNPNLARGSAHFRL